MLFLPFCFLVLIAGKLKFRHSDLPGGLFHFLHLLGVGMVADIFRQIHDRDQHHVIVRRILHGGNAARLVRDDILKHIADFARIGKILLPEHLSGDNAGPDLLLGVLLHNIVVLGAVQIKYGFKLVDRVVRKFEILVESGLKSGVTVNELLHRICVSRDYDDQIIPVILHCLEDRVDRFLSESVVLLGERVRLVDEQNSAHRFFDLFLRLEGRLSHIPGYQSGAVDFDQLPFREHSDLLVQSADDPRDRSFACPGITGKHKMKGYRHGL